MQSINLDPFVASQTPIAPDNLPKLSAVWSVPVAGNCPLGPGDKLID
jgi:hypothetical protein